MRAETFAKLFCIIILTVSTPQLIAAGLKRVLVLDIINIDGAEEYTYLETTITSALRTKLQSEFAYEKTPQAEWRAIAEDNFIFRKDYHTETASFNLGLLTRQDIVISGGFTAEAEVAGSDPFLNLNINIYDLQRKEIAARLEKKLPINQNLFAEIDRAVAELILAASTVLPSKEEWRRRKLSGREVESKPLFKDIRTGIRLGGAFYSSGYADRWQVSQPSLGFQIQAKSPFFWHRLLLGAHINIVRHTWRKDFNAVTQSFNLSTTNYLFGGSVGAGFELNSDFSLQPALGAGIVMQNSQIAGEISQSTQNDFAYMAGFLSLVYHLNQRVDLNFEMGSFIFLESGQTTALNNIRIGGDYRL